MAIRCLWLGNIAHHARAVGLLVAVCSVAPGPILANQAPLVDSFTASPATVAPGGTATLTVSASDPDCAESCTSGCGEYVRADLTQWAATGGAFVAVDNGTSASPYTATAEWQAPAVEATYTIEVTLSDSGSFLCGGRQSTTASLFVTVTSTSNQAPMVDSVDADPSRLFPGESAQLSCSATDPDGDPLTYSWSTDLGTVTPALDGAAVFDSGHPGVATITCIATDPFGAPGIGSVAVSVSDVVAERTLHEGLASPQRLAVDSFGSLFAADRSGGGIVVLRLEDGRLMYRIPVAEVTAVAVDWADRLLVGTSSGAAVVGRDGTVIRQLLVGAGETSDVAVDLDGRHWVVLQRHRGRAVVFDDAGTVVAEIGTTGDGPDQLRSPSGVAVLPDGRIVIADAGHRALKIFNLDGTLSLTIGGGGSGAGNFVELDDVAVDSRGVIWVSDAFQDWVQSFATDGSLRELVGTYGDDVGELKTAAGIAVAESYGSLVVASLNGSAAQVFQLGPPSPVDWPAAEAALSTDSLVFPVQEVATTSAALRVDLFNTGDAPLGVSGTEVTGPFAVSGECIVVDPGGGCSFDVAFRPPLAGYHAGELALHTSAGAQPLRIDLSGVGFLPARLVVDPPGLHFSPQGVGTTSDVQTVVLSNPGTETLNLGQITLDEPFGISSHCGWELAGGSACTLWVDFSPTVAGATAGALTIHSDAPDSTRVVPLTGHGEILELSPQPARVNFGYLKPGLISQTEQIQVVNTGTAKVVVEDVSLAGADPGEFEIVTDQCGGNPIDVGQSCWLQARFSPSAIGVRSARLLLPITGGLQFNVELVGGEISLFTDGFESGNTSAWPIGLPGKSLRVRPIAIDFGEVELGAASGMRIVTVTNSGQRAVWLGRLQVVGENAPDFVIDEDHCGSAWLEAGESCWFAVDMLTLMEGSLSALVEIPASTAEDGPPDPVHLEGTVWWP